MLSGDGSQQHTNGVSVPADYSLSLIRLSELRIGCTGYILQVRRRGGPFRVFLGGGGNLVGLGGQPFRVPVRLVDGKFVQGVAQDSYAREFGIQHTYVAPEQGAAKFEWRDGYSFLRAPAIRAQRFFV